MTNNHVEVLLLTFGSRKTFFLSLVVSLFLAAQTSTDFPSFACRPESARTNERTRLAYEARARWRARAVARSQSGLRILLMAYYSGRGFWIRFPMRSLFPPDNVTRLIYLLGTHASCRASECVNGASATVNIATRSSYSFSYRLCRFACDVDEGNCLFLNVSSAYYQSRKSDRRITAL